MLLAAAMARRLHGPVAMSSSTSSRRRGRGARRGLGSSSPERFLGLVLVSMAASGRTKTSVACPPLASATIRRSFSYRREIQSAWNWEAAPIRSTPSFKPREASANHIWNGVFPTRSCRWWLKVLGERSGTRGWESVGVVARGCLAILRSGTGACSTRNTPAT